MDDMSKYAHRLRKQGPNPRLFISSLNLNLSLSLSPSPECPQLPWAPHPPTPPQLPLGKPHAPFEVQLFHPGSWTAGCVWRPSGSPQLVRTRHCTQGTSELMELRFLLPLPAPGPEERRVMFLDVWAPIPIDYHGCFII